MMPVFWRRLAREIMKTSIPLGFRLRHTTNRFFVVVVLVVVVVIIVFLPEKVDLAAVECALLAPCDKVRRNANKQPDATARTAAIITTISANATNIITTPTREHASVPAGYLHPLPGLVEVAA